ncbi:MAG: DUF1822 family protein [Cyanobacteria bacterium SBLK]|nr:DUF1822 family protein [Cyanobacteria bacterium SBLK]
MNANQIEELSFIVPLTIFDHQIAREFCQQQIQAQKAKQVYLNTLSVCAVRAYLTGLGVETRLESGDSWNVLAQTLSDTADLEVKGCGKLECRPVLPHASICTIPPESWGERLGYVAVELNRELTEARLLGFIAEIEVGVEELPLDRLSSLETLLDCLSQKSAAMEKPFIRLSRWFDNVIDAGWESLDAVFASHQTTPVFAFRSLSGREEGDRHGIRRGKIFNLARSQEQVTLSIGLELYRATEYDISIAAIPGGSQAHLPEDLQLILLDPDGKSIMQADARNSEGLELQFSGELGEYFSIKMVLGEVSVTEEFQI